MSTTIDDAKIGVGCVILVVLLVLFGFSGIECGRRGGGGHHNNDPGFDNTDVPDHYYGR